MENNQIENLTDLFKKQSELYSKIESKKVDVTIAAQMNNAADKMIKIVSIQASYTKAEDISKLDILK